MAVHANREMFRKHYEFVAVRHIRLSRNDVLEPGQPIDKTKIKLFHLRSLYQRRRIGVAGSPWAEAMLATVGNAFSRPEVEKPKPESAPAVPSAEGGDQTSPNPTDARGGDAVGDALVEDAIRSGVEVVDEGKGWRSIFVNGALVTRVRGADALAAWMKENGHAES